MPRELIAFTGDDGVASVRVVPGSHLTIELECDGMFSKENSTIKLVMGNESRQFQVGWVWPTLNLCRGCFMQWLVMANKSMIWPALSSG